MENAEQIRSYVADVVRQIDGEAITDLDFDCLRRTLTELTSLYDRIAQLDLELNLLRQDYIKRIGGMEKAIAVAGRNRDSIKQALEGIEELDTLSAAELLDRYHKTQGRFQDAFPTSFGILTRQNRRVSRAEFSHLK